MQARADSPQFPPVLCLKNHVPRHPAKHTQTRKQAIFPSMMTDAPVSAPIFHHPVDVASALPVAAHPIDIDQSTAASSPSAVDDDAGVSPEVPPTVADTEAHDSPRPGKDASDHIAVDIVDNAGLEPQPELATEPSDHDGASFTDETPLRLQEADDAMDIDAGIVVEDLAAAAPQEPLQVCTCYSKHTYSLRTG